MRSDRVSLRQGPVVKTSIAYRPEFNNWSCKLRIGFDASVLTPHQVISLLAHAGMKNGVGEWRPQKGGDHGRFQVFPAGKAKALLSEASKSTKQAKPAKSTKSTKAPALSTKRKVTTAEQMVANKLVRRNG